MYEVANRQHSFYMDHYFLFIQYKIEFLIKDNRLSIKLKTQSIPRVAIEFVMKYDGLGI